MKNMSIILGFLAGVGLPIQTSVNTRLRKKVGSPYNASLVSFVVALLFLSALLLITGQGLHIPLAQLLNEPAWIWIGGICGLVFLTGNILLFSKLGGVQTVVLPVLGQILMGLIIDNFGLFYSQKTPLSVFRIAGAVMVILGVVLVSMAKENKTASEKLQKSESTTLWIWRAFGIFAGMLSATQIAVNGYLGKVVGSPIKASAISFTVGIIFLAIICIVLHFKNGKSESFKNESAKNPWWMWIGGILGGLYILANVYLSRIVGTGMTVIILLIGSTTGGILVDHFGMFESPKKPINAQKILGVLIMILGAAAIKLL
ncbi:DMT family transporter [Blautia sp. AF19-10LB]|jgi:transporter family-2 protein|uniref:DMT family transporter n=2 Tax=Blautia TaxID=572511 RepID=UPI0018F398FF|nr:DMT family transporter [Blautia sp. AF19-10LB]